MQEFSSAEQTIPGSPDDAFLEDLNPCLTPCSSKAKSKVGIVLIFLTSLAFKSLIITNLGLSIGL